MVKKVLFGLIVLFACTGIVKAQSQEPEFVGEVNIVKDEAIFPLEKEYATVKTKAGASLYLVGIGSVKSKINVKGAKSNCRVNQNDTFNLIVRGVDNQSDPMSIISIFQFEESRSARKAELTSLNTFGGSNSNKLNLLEFTAKKFGESSYILTIQNVRPGEFGVIVKNPNNKDEKSVIVACFGID